MFYFHKINRESDIPWVRLTCGSITPKSGMALKLSSGKLVLATGSDMPEYISMVERSASAENEEINVVPVSSEIVFGVACSAAHTNVDIGDFVTIAPDALRVTATSGGCAKVVGREGTAEGDIQYIVFDKSAVVDGEFDSLDTQIDALDARVTALES